MHENHSPVALLALVCAGLSAVILVTYVVQRPPLTGVSKIWLFPRKVVSWSGSRG